ncbi:MAG TPA: M18 family aminopeptidase [Oceanospirillales bacterium]|nr:M18 family aminopeptidase [Oceanospirillales bacterium]|tara:strand:- start:232 stop:1527 length:1296 start_codon:yes stop_codon:yes gene_type:complete
MSKSLLSLSDFNQSLLGFLQASPTPFHATDCMANTLIAAGYTELFQDQTWQLEEQAGYFIRRNDSSIIAIWLADKSQALRLIGAHTDSPCLKVKPNADLTGKGYFQLGVEVYGGALLAPWFDRDLSLAGRVHARINGKIESVMINFERAIATVPSLAIHLDREANSGRTINPQTQLPPVLAIVGENKRDLNSILMAEVRKQHEAVESILDYELFFYDTQPPAMIGLDDEFIASARLDNLLSCHIGLQALLSSGSDQNKLFICTDHEEVGSVSACGAQGPFLEQTIERIWPNVEDRNRVVAGSMMISADNAHAIHPNFSDKHDQNHGPMLNQGPVIKINANQRYATNSFTSAVFKQLCNEAEVKYQAFVTRTDLGCGSTIGPAIASNVGVDTIDIGVPTFGMHSIRELAGSGDAFDLAKVLKHFYEKPSLIE